QYEMNVADKSKENPKEFFSYIRDKKVIRNHIGSLLSTEGQLEYSNEEMCNILNNYFSSVFVNETPQSEFQTETCEKSRVNLLQ
ncbi:hypothetical protein, partial [Stenotrophomonas sp. SY1]|uniref:hypothetical protein n=1 Tax=Stenotrophomonas sp. SY1 TaxID=477235 RepID=UPI001E29479E